MQIYGQFAAQDGAIISVVFTAPGTAGDIEIGDGSLWFADAEAFTIKSDVSDTFDHVLTNTATARLMASGYTAAMFQSSARGASIVVKHDDDIVFLGWVVPRSYSQDFNSRLDQLDVNCTDCLGVLESSRFLNIDAAGSSYANARANAEQRTVKDIITSLINASMPDGYTANIWYDGSRATDNTGAKRYTLFDELTLSDLLFLGDSESDTWTNLEVMQEIMRYFNLRIMQRGTDFYIYDLSAAKGYTDVEWVSLTTGATKTTEAQTVRLTNSNAADCADKISIGDTYSRLSLTADVKESADIVQSPLDDDLLTSPYPRRQYYCTEYETTEPEYLWALTRDTGLAYGDGVNVRHWLLRVMDNPQWKFPYYSGGMRPQSTGQYLPDVYCSTGKNQQALPNALTATQGAAIFRVACADVSEDVKDNSPASKPDENTMLVVSVNGNLDDTEAAAMPDAEALKGSCPRATYAGAAGGSLSPSDPRATNYIVFSGNISLVPVQPMTDPYNVIHDDSSDPTTWTRTTVKRKDDKSRWYTRRYWKAADAFDTPVTDTLINYGWTPMADTAPQAYKFKYSAIGDSEDHVSKVAVLACMLIVGDKCAVETGTDGALSDIVWQTYKTREECADDDEYFAQSFTLGFDPKIGDYLIGTEFEMQNNVLWDTGIEATGTAIPIKQSDHVAGKVQFMILGPVNTLWDEVTRRHPTFFRHTSWSTTSIPLLAHVAHIQVKNFKIEICSDNAHAADTDADIVYTSDTDSAFCSVKDDLEFKINSALTTPEALSLGASAAPALSNPVISSTGEPVTVLYDYVENATAKPEKTYLNAAWQEWHAPRIQIDTALTYSAYAPFAQYAHPALTGRRFFVLGADFDLQEAVADLRLRESDITDPNMGITLLVSEDGQAIITEDGQGITTMDGW